MPIMPATQLIPNITENPIVPTAAPMLPMKLMLLVATGLKSHLPLQFILNIVSLHVYRLNGNKLCILFLVKLIDWI